MTLICLLYLKITYYMIKIFQLGVMVSHHLVLSFSSSPGGKKEKEKKRGKKRKDRIITIAKAKSSASLIFFT
jgi:ribosomal protein L11